MKQELLNKALNNIRERRMKAEDKANCNKKIALKDDIFNKLYYQYTNLLIENARKRADNQPVDDNKLNEYKKKYMDRLEILGITEIEPVYSCNKCNDQGIVEGKYCSCLKQEIAKILIKNSGFSKLEDFSNSNFNLFSKEEEIKKVYSLMKEWCNKDSKKKIIYLMGDTGTGKTYLMSCMANEFIKQGKFTILTTSFNLFNVFLEYHKTKNEDLLENYLSCEVLFVDDLGSEPFYNNVSREYFYLLINERSMKGLRTVITSNLTPESLRDRYDERTFSRIMDNNVSVRLKIGDRDLRTQKKTD